jgi:hypothetical protein
VCANVRCGRRKEPSLWGHLNNATAGWVKIQYIQRTAVSRDGRSASAYSYKWAPRAAQTKAQLPMQERVRVWVLISCARASRKRKLVWGKQQRHTGHGAFGNRALSAKGKEVVARHCGPQFEMSPELNVPTM